jgi:nucleoside-diphosphate kinase
VNLAIERTLAIIKPDAVSRGLTSDILKHIHEAKFKIVAIKSLRLTKAETMGATDPAKAAPGSIRKTFGTSIQNNCTHGSDAPETAKFELSYFFSGMELI